MIFMLSHLFRFICLENTSQVHFDCNVITVLIFLYGRTLTRLQHIIRTSSARFVIINLIIQHVLKLWHRYSSSPSLAMKLMESVCFTVKIH